MSATIIDFTQPIAEYQLRTDATERQAGLSQAAFAYHPGLSQQNHVFFTHLKPQPNGAAFAIVKTSKFLTLNTNDNLCITTALLSEGEVIYQLVLETADSLKQRYNYQANFTASQKKKTTAISLNQFIAMARGQQAVDAPALDYQNIQSIGIQIVGRPDDQSTRQSGVYALALFSLSRC